MNINGIEVTLGADPEIFVGRAGQFFSAHETAIEGNKKDPMPVNKGAVQIDGMALEFNIDPASNYQEFQENLDVVQAQLAQLLQPGMEFLDVASVIFSAEFLKDIPYENVRLGCEPDYNGYMVAKNPAPDQNALMRTAGGHVHIGGIGPSEDNRRKHLPNMARLTRLMDEEVGVYSTLWDKDDRRRALYGKAGCYRPKPYGMEYRSMSNAWLFSKKVTEFVFNATIDAVQRYLDGDDVKSEQAREIMNNSDRGNSFFDNNFKANLIRSF